MQRRFSCTRDSKVPKVEQAAGIILGPAGIDPSAAKGEGGNRSLLSRQAVDQSYCTFLTERMVLCRPVE